MRNSIFILGILFLFTSCGKDLEKYNEDPKNPVSVDPTYMFTYAQWSFAKQYGDFDYNANPGVLWANYATQTTYVQEANYDAANRDIGGSMWDNIYTEGLYELKQAKKTLYATEALTPEDEEIKNNKIALIKIMEVWAYQYLVDNFGNIPFTEALDADNLTPVYDDDEFVYTAISDSLNDAISKLTIGAPSFENFGSDPTDIIYEGDVAMWKKFAHTLQLKLGTRVSKSNPTMAGDLITAAVDGGVFTSSEDNPLVHYTGTIPYVNPVYDFFIIDSRDTDFVATVDFLGLLEGLNDPRVDTYYDDNFDPKVGGVYGANGNAYSELTHIHPAYTDNSTRPTALLDYTTVCFELAEAVERGFITGVAADYYTDGIVASFESVGLTEADALAYIAADAPYNPTDWEESIGTQKYIAVFPNGHEAWTEARRLGAPQLATAAASGRENPNRMIYPTDEPRVNPTHYDEAASAIGGDNTESKVFWDID